MINTNVHRIKLTICLVATYFAYVSTIYGNNVPVPKTDDMFYGSATVIINNRDLKSQFDVSTGQNIFAMHYNKSDIKSSKEMSNFTWCQYKQREQIAQGWTWSMVDNSANASWTIESKTMKCIEAAPYILVPISELLKQMSYSGSFIFNGRKTDIWSQTLDFETYLSISLLEPDPSIGLSFPIMSHSYTRLSDVEYFYENLVPTTPPASMFVLPAICKKH